MIPWEKIFRPSQRIFGTILEVFYYYSEDGELLDSDSRLNTYHLLSNLCWVTVEQGRQKSGASTNPAETQMWGKLTFWTFNCIFTAFTTFPEEVSHGHLYHTKVTE